MCEYSMKLYIAVKSFICAENTRGNLSFECCKGWQASTHISHYNRTTRQYRLHIAPNHHTHIQLLIWKGPFLIVKYYRMTAVHKRSLAITERFPFNIKIRFIKILWHKTSEFCSLNCFAAVNVRKLNCWCAAHCGISANEGVIGIYDDSNHHNRVIYDQKLWRTRVFVALPHTTTCEEFYTLCYVAIWCWWFLKLIC